ncbi:ABC transporter permease [Kiloniella laminariae]|uniref:ABC transporter permease n=1 Tax=Kiloniella laminariae TaxID=454162 RepID=A0ABT4LT12_9PROT|nr:ABC transporter permease [Kiloniella laminariae]MCZ4283062.1 ABC transporter permease [Kiloniella laminariae]
MLNYAFKRVMLGILILLFTMMVMYVAVYLIPGDPAAVALGPRATPEMKADLLARMGLDQPIYIQFSSFIVNILHGDLGLDVWSNREVSAIISETMPNTMILAFASIGWALALGIPLGCFSVIYRNSFVDRIIGILSVSFIAIPSFVVAIFVLLIFAVQLRWLPAIGAGEEGDILSQARALILPAFAIGLGWVGYLARMVRASMLEVMGEQHIRTARAFGLSETRVVFRYALAISLIPVISLIAVGMGGIISGSVFAEIIFARPGIGNLTYNAVTSRNYPVVMGAVMVTTVFYVSITVMADLLMAYTDPRVRDVLK